MFKVQKSKLSASKKRKISEKEPQETAPHLSSIAHTKTAGAPKGASLEFFKPALQRPDNMARMSEVFSKGEDEIIARIHGVKTEKLARQLRGDSAESEEKTVVCFVAPVLPHACELELWNGVVEKLGFRGVLITAHQEQKNYIQFLEMCRADKITVSLECRALETTTENKTFLAGLESELVGCALVVTVGEASMASFQAMKARRQNQNRLVLWQNSPRPPSSLSTFKTTQNNIVTSQLAREKTVRREVLRSCDSVVAFDKDSATWAYLEDVNAKRIRRVMRGVNTARFSKDITAVRRLELRKSLGLPEADFIFLQAGPLEIESGALDTVYAFKNLLQSHAPLMGTTKLAFCGTGSASAEVRQAVVDLQLDDQVFFLNPNDPNATQIFGNQISTLLAVCDTILHNPVGATNGSPSKFLDCTYDLLCSVASSLTVVSNGNGWVGEWLARFYRTFACGSIHSQARMMFDAIEKQDRLAGIKRAARKAIENELEMRMAVDELAKVFENLMAAPVAHENGDVAQLFEQIERTVQARQYLDAISFIGAAFNHPALTESQRASLFRHVGDCFTKLGDLENGLQNYARALEIDPYCAKTLIGLGTIALQTHNYIVAVPQFQKAVALAPQDDMASLGLGLAFEGLGEPHEALNWTARACNLNIENTAAIFNIVKLAHDLDQYSEAENILTRYVGLHPHDANMTFTLGGIAFKTGRLEMAARLMENILVFDPMNSRAHALLAQMNRRAEQKRQA